MRIWVAPLIIFLHVTTTIYGSCPTHDQPVSWSFRWNRVTHDEIMLVISAGLAPGWHLYSQFIARDGPIPTQLTFSKSDEFNLLGKPGEEGVRETYYDSAYDMSVTFFSHAANFTQRVKLYKPETKIYCKVTFIICNEHQCIPLCENLTIPIDLNNYKN
jgi:hypothetical protein